MAVRLLTTGLPAVRLLPVTLLRVGLLTIRLLTMGLLPILRAEPSGLVGIVGTTHGGLLL
ncbi:hypothetical protein GORBP_065_00520 [Gordonia rubripertincta NBRC 101908]|uniref:Uncharacterized protein n=1 Tax=Gordonia rubripertincta NBRC 101908 TaxID=1077975 RepID=A0ABQ0HTY9_GORRU|nr:hypothetical protein GORBP_065_00520 [Gordonia rubripertincta NBRC 101908]